MTTRHTVLVVEDHEPFRRRLCELLRQRGTLRIVGEAADGLDAIRQAEAQRPDVVVLDVGLPVLSGFEVAGRLRAIVPDARLIFVTNEPSLELVELAFTIGASGYVYKARAQRDVLPVLEAVLRGARFVSGGLERIDRGNSLASHRHDLLFCSSDAILVQRFARFIAGVLREGNAVIVAVSEAHERSLRRSLQSSHIDVDGELARAIRQERYVPLNIGEMLAKVMVNARPDPTRFVNAADDLVTEATRRASSQHAKVAACGECSGTLWAQGQVEAAIQLEHLWDELAASRQIDILCAYPLTTRDEHVQVVRSLCAEHTAVEIS